MATAKKITISEVLKGLTPGKMQSVGYMQIIPLICPPDMVDNRFGSFTELMTSTRGYGTLVIENKTDKHTIFPMGAGIVVNQAAQNHAVGGIKLMPPKTGTAVETAACIQESQGGYIDRGQHFTTILPYSVRQNALQLRSVVSYSKLWPAISAFNRDLKVTDRSGRVLNVGHLEYYLDQFKNDLDEFIGHFEIVENQVGAIILLNGQVAGIERAPNYEYWRELWRPLIRECYGSQSLMFAKKKKKPSPPLGRMPINAHKVTDLDSLEAELQTADSFEEDEVKKLIRSFIKKSFKMTREENEPNGTLCVDHLSGSQFTGQVVRDDDRIVYASLIPDKNAKFNVADEFSI